MYDLLVVGSGLYGAVFAQQAAEAGKRVLVLEKRRHIGGNCYSYQDEDTGILVHQYGTHIFHTNDRKIWNYVNRFTGFNAYRHRVRAVCGERVFAMPINLGTINSFFGVNLRPCQVEHFLAEQRGHYAQPANLEEKAISLVGRPLYEAFIKGYTLKQWGTDPRNLPASIITRLPVRTSYNDDYFNDQYQGIPLEGYTPIFERLLADIDVELGVDFLEDRYYWFKKAKKILYTGPIDKYFEYTQGPLGWRSVRLELQRVDVEDWQGISVMNYPGADIPFTRIHEYKHLHPERRHSAGKSLIMREFSLRDDHAPYYPINSEPDRLCLAKYKALCASEDNVLFGGRLAEYKYYDMDQVIGAALKKSSTWLTGRSLSESQAA